LCYFSALSSANSCLSEGAAKISAMAIYHVAVDGSDHNDGSEASPFQTINRAAQAAFPGDTVQVHQGTYREWVKPVRGGIDEARRITFEAAQGEKVAIKGSEVVIGWVNDGGDVWRVEVPNSVFGDFNPFAEKVWGDWIIIDDQSKLPHRGEVYLDGKALYEAFSRDEVAHPQVRTLAYPQPADHWTHPAEPHPHPEDTTLVWFAEVGPEVTTIWANFGGVDPNHGLTEINVRPAVFYPEKNHLDYITVRGFELTQAATPWTPPTADQPGLIGPNWAKGWIIEDNEISNAKCSGISIGKEASTGHNFAIIRGDKPGYQYQLESVFTAKSYGWDKNHIGSHIIRRNVIHHCGQNGIVGHLGCIYSRIEDNHIYEIGQKHEFYGYEIGGIKLHGALDVQIIHNRIHDTSLGLWLDWQNQGARISRNLFYRNIRDIFLEVSHGPALVDHNIFASPQAIDLWSQGNAFVNNLVTGSVRSSQVLDRATPYHVPHSTEVAGYAFHYGGDDRFVGNLFLGEERADDYALSNPKFVNLHGEIKYGTAAFDGYPDSWEEYKERVGPYSGRGDHTRFHNERQAVYLEDNVYTGTAAPFEKETHPVVAGGSAQAELVDEGDAVYLETDLPAAATKAVRGVVTSGDLGRVRIVDAPYENPDGSPITADTDLLGAQKSGDQSYPAGPLADLPAGKNRVRVW